LEETTYYYQHYIEDGVKIIVKFKSTINGTWEILLGDLDFSYNLSSLKVQYVDMNFPYSSNLESYFIKELIASLGESLIKEDENELYDTLYDYYRKYKEVSYLDIKINGNVMTLTTEDGEVEWQKVKTNL
jgi:hypothetical protein